MPPSRAESVATVGASARALRTSPLLRFAPPPLHLLLYFYYTSTLSRQIRLPSPTVPRIAIPPFHHPLSVAAVARAPVVGPATTSCVCPTLSLPCVCVHVRDAHITSSRVPSPSDDATPASSPRRCASTENKIGVIADDAVNRARMISGRIATVVARISRVFSLPGR